MSLKDFSTHSLERELQRRKDEKDRRDALTPEQRLAETLHYMLCHWNHTDGCDWYYGSWKDDSNTGKRMSHAHKEYLKKAKKALEVASEDVIIKVLSAVR